MVFPTALTVDDDLEKYAFFQEAPRLLERGNTYDALHEGVTEEIVNWLESEGGIADVDKIDNPSVFKPAAVQLVIAKIHRGRGEFEQANEYARIGMLLMRKASAALTEKKAAGGVVAELVLLKQGEATYYTSRRAGQLFDRGRSQPG